MKHKHAELIKLWADGAEIEHQLSNGEWEYTHTPKWFNDVTYRIRPEKVTRYLWAYRHKEWTGMDIFLRFMDDIQANRWAIFNSYVIKRLDWSATEFEG